MDDLTESALTHVIEGADLTDAERAALVRAVRAAQGLTVEQLPAPTKVPRTQGLMGPAEVAALFQVKVGTVRQWRNRGKTPPPTEVLSGRPAWGRSVIAAWVDEIRACV